MLEEFYYKKKKVLSCIGLLKELTKKLEIQQASSVLDKISERVNNEKLYLGIVGQFKRGKSTLANYFLGKQVLPTGILPLTSIVTIIEYGQRECLRIIFTDGKSVECKVEQLREYITEEGNPNNSKNVSMVCMQIDLPILKDGLVLVDTPGIGSTFLSNTETTLSFLPQLDAVIFLIGCDPPISAVEIEILKNLTKNYNVIIALNKIDIISEDERRMCIEFSRKVIMDSLGNLVDILPISSKLALQSVKEGSIDKKEKSRIERLNIAINNLVQQGKYSIQIRSAIRRLMSIIADIKSALTLKQKILISPLKDTDVRIQQLEKEMASVQDQKILNHHLINVKFDGFKGIIKKDTDAFCKETIKSLNHEVNSILKQNKGLNNSNYAKAFDAWLFDAIEKKSKLFIEQEELRLNEACSEFLKVFSERIDTSTNKSREIIGKIFELELGKAEIQIEIVVKNKIAFTTENLIGWGLDSIPLILPQRAFQKYIGEKVASRIDTEVHRNASHIEDHLYDRLDDIKASLHTYTDETGAILFNTINNSLILAHKTREEGDFAVKNSLDAIEHAIVDISCIEKDLETISIDLKEFRKTK